MKCLFITLLLLTSNLFANDEIKYIQTDKLQILSLTDESTEFEIAVDFRSSGFLQALLTLDLDNVIGVNITDINLEKKLCKYRDKNWQVFFIKVLEQGKNIAKKNHIRIKLPCVVSNKSRTKHQALLKIKVLTSDNKHYENTVKLKIVGREWDTKEGED